MESEKEPLVATAVEVAGASETESVDLGTKRDMSPEACVLRLKEALRAEIEKRIKLIQDSKGKTHFEKCTTIRLFYETCVQGIDDPEEAFYRTLKVKGYVGTALLRLRSKFDEVAVLTFDTQYTAKDRDGWDYVYPTYDLKTLEKKQADCNDKCSVV